MSFETQDISNLRAKEQSLRDSSYRLNAAMKAFSEAGIAVRVAEEALGEARQSQVDADVALSQARMEVLRAARDYAA